MVCEFWKIVHKVLVKCCIYGLQEKNYVRIIDASAPNMLSLNFGRDYRICYLSTLKIHMADIKMLD